MIWKLGFAVSFQAVYLSWLVQLLHGGIPFTSGFLANLSDLSRRGVLGLGCRSGILRGLGRDELQDALGCRQDQCMQRKMAAIGEHQFVELDVNLVVGR